VQRTLGRVKIECVKGDIAAQPDVDAVVNAANAQLRTGGGVAGAIHRAAGPGLEEECRSLAPVPPGEAVITGAHDLPNRYVIHALGPVYGSDRPEDELLARCYRNSLARAEEREIRSIAFPALSTGAFGYPLEEAAGVALGAILDQTAKLSSVELVRFVLFSDRELAAHEKALARLADG
jgi:O-acetyl-ADP-ribose deacetylase (regulator of RNase III)